MKTILVLCTGDSCRSQIAGAYLEFFTSDKATVYSAGLHPEFLHPLAVRVMRADGIDISNHVSNPIQRFESQHFDYLITLSDKAKENLPPFICGEQILHWDIPDPTSAQGTFKEQLKVFSQVQEEIKREVLKFVGREFPLPLMKEAV